MNARELVGALLEDDQMAERLEKLFTPGFFDTRLSFSDDYGSEFQGSPYSGTQCTGFALEVLKRLGKNRVTIWGYPIEDNSQAQAGQDIGGHDFALVDGRFIVDGWVRDIAAEQPRAVFDLESPQDAEIIKQLYGDRSKWQRMPRAESYADITDQEVFDQRRGKPVKKKRQVSQKRRVRQNAFGNWRGYIGNKFVREFPQDVAFLVSGPEQAGFKPGSSTEMPEEAREWLHGDTE